MTCVCPCKWIDFGSSLTTGIVHFICTVLLVLIHSNFFLQAYQVDICRFDSFDLDADQQITETELAILIDITGLVDLDELFEQLDVNKGKPNLYV